MSAILDRPLRHLIPAAEYLRMAAAGVFEPEARLELIEGEILEMAPIDSPHAGTVKALTKMLVLLSGDQGIVGVQDPLVIGERSVPQPDLTVLRPRADSYRASHPNERDVLLVVEVSDSTLRFDLGTKARIYAAARVPEYWVVDVAGRAIRVFRDPRADGYATALTASVGDTVRSQLLPQIELTVAAVFPDSP